MPSIKILLFLLLILVDFKGFLVAQPPPVSSNRGNSSKESKPIESFVSLEGKFSINLPKYVYRFQPINPTEGINNGGGQFVWQIPQGVFTIVYFDQLFTSGNVNGDLDSAAAILNERLTANGNSKLISTRRIPFGELQGLELTFQSKNGQIAVARYYLIKNRLYILSSGWKEGENGESELKTLDSFKVIDRKAVIAKMVEDATPAPLPQSPATKKPKSDAEDDGLKGKVKSVIEERGDASGERLRTTVENYYNENGNKFKSIFYDYRGNPDAITAYGFIDGMRVSKNGYVSGYEYNPPPPKALASTGAKPQSENKPTVDSRYTVKYEYKYEENRLKETLAYGNNGVMNNKTVFVYDGKKLEKTSFDKDGKLNWKIVEAYDDKGNLVERTFVRNDSKYSDSTYTYTYESFDEKGNWTKRIVNGKEGQFGGGFKDQHYVEYRKITYFP